MGLFVFSLATVLATFGLLVVGGAVNPSGSSLACPDWPTCYGSFFPEMVGGVEYEHTHRVVATAVGFMTAVLAGWLFAKRREDPVAARLGLLAAVLVIVQGVLGGITVLLRLPLLVSTAHLALSMIFFSLLLYITLRLWPSWRTRFPSVRAARDVGSKLASRRWVGVAALLVYVQIVLGAFVRHTSSGHACHDDWLLCAGELWPGWGPAQLHMVHRFVGIFVLLSVVGVGAAAYRVALRLRRPTARWLALGAPVLALAQVALGMVSVATGIAVVPVTAHLAGAALLLADLVALYFALPVAVEPGEFRAHEPRLVRAPAGSTAA